MPAITSILLGVGLAASAAGTAMSMEASSKAASVSQDMAQQEQGIEAQRKQAMELDARRKQLEIVRQAQRTRAMALSSATNQGAQFGSGLQGGYGQISGEAGTNMLGVQQNLQIGENIFGYNSQISQDKMSMAQAQGFGAIGQGISSLGGAAIKSLGPINSLSQGFGSSYGITGNAFSGFLKGSS
jgi:hypothetical protein